MKYTEDAFAGTKQEVIERAKILKMWNDPTAQIKVQKDEIPLWFAHLVRGTWFEFLAYDTLGN